MGGGPAGVQTWSTRGVPAVQQLDYWVGAICERFLEMSPARAVQKNFVGELIGSRCGAIGVHRITSDPLNVARTAQAISRSAKEFYYLLCMPDSPWSVSHGGRQVALNPGDLVVIDSREPYELRFPSGGTSFSLELPVAWMKNWVPNPDALTGQRLDARAGWAATLSSFLKALTPEGAAAGHLPETLLNDQLGGLIALVADSAAPHTRLERVQPRSLSTAVLRALQEHYAMPGLTAAHIARTLGVSDRTVHRAMGAQRLTFSAALMRERMDAARRMVGDARFAGLTLGEIGRRVGLLDPSHFVRQYRRYFGETPGRDRRRA